MEWETHGVGHTGNEIHTESDTKGVRSGIHMKQNTHGVGYTEWDTHGVEYIWIGIYTEWNTHGVRHTRSEIQE